MDSKPTQLLHPSQPFPPLESAWGEASAAPGLLAVGGDLSVARLYAAYRQGVFPWFSEGQPILWWSPDPRMVLVPAQFKLHPSLRKTIRSLLKAQRLQIRIDTQFAQVIQACSDASRHGQSGTWIVPDMVHAYRAFHRAGHVHSVECWIDGSLAGGLYAVAIGQAVFGESMFHRRTDASKIALAALVALCLAQGVQLIDCQQNTAHLASLGAAEISRGAFAQHLALATQAPPVQWQFEPLYWSKLAI